MKICIRCNEKKTDGAFGKMRNGKRTPTCMKCYRGENYNEKIKLLRKKLPEKFIVEDSKRSDKKKCFKNDLDVNFVKSLISLPCSYCGETKLRMTLDRIDNAIGHLKSNVVQACIRCNYTRRDMPYEAWLFLINGMKMARQAGVFNEWTGKCR